MPVLSRRSRIHVGKSLTAFAVAGLTLTGILASPAAAVPTHVTMAVGNVRGSISGPTNCPNISFDRVTSLTVYFGQAPPHPARTTRTISCTRGTTVVRAGLETVGYYYDVNRVPTIGRGYQLSVHLEQNGGAPFLCGRTSTTSALGGTVISGEFPMQWSQLRHYIGLSTRCQGHDIQVGLDFSEGTSAP